MGLIRNNFLILILLFCTFLSCKPRKDYTRVSSNQNEIEEPFTEGEVYTRNTGHRNLVGKLTLVRQNNHYQLRLPVVFIGAGLFSRTTPEKVKAFLMNDQQVPEAYFGTGEYNISSIPALKNILLNKLIEIEQRFKTDFCSLKIEPQFIDERTILSQESIDKLDYSPYLAGLNNAAEKFVQDNIKNPDSPLPIIVLAIPSATVVTPTAWDPYTISELLAHETGHLIGINSEGYEYDDYPPNGLMNDEMSFNLVKKFAPDVEIKIQDTDFNEIFVDSWGIPRKWKPEVDEEQILQHFTRTNSIYADSARANYSALSQEKRQEIVQKAIERWLKNIK